MRNWKNLAVHRLRQLETYVFLSRIWSDWRLSGCTGTLKSNLRWALVSHGLPLVCCWLPSSSAGPMSLIFWPSREVAPRNNQFWAAMSSVSKGQTGRYKSTLSVRQQLSYHEKNPKDTTSLKKMESVFKVDSVCQLHLFASHESKNSAPTNCSSSELISCVSASWGCATYPILITSSTL